MARRKPAASKQEGNEDRGDLIKVAVVNDRTIVNGHVLKSGTVVGMYDDEIEKHRRAGVALEDVADDDKREVFDVQTPYEAKEEDEGEQQEEKSE